MKKLFLILVAAVLSLCVFEAQAQFDLYGSPRLILLTGPNGTANLIQSGATTLNTTNIPIDMHSYEGVAGVFITATNTAADLAPKIYAYLQGSNDKASWYILTNVSIATSTEVILTNIGATTIKATNTTLLPGVITAATPDTSGFAGNYMVPEPFTNRAVAFTNVSGGVAFLGLSIPNQPRYIALTTTVTGSNCVYVVSGAVIARRQLNTW